MSCGLFSMFDPIVHIPPFGELGVKWLVVGLPLAVFLPWQVGPAPVGLGGLVSFSLVKYALSVMPSGVFFVVFFTILSFNLSSLSPMSYTVTAHPGIVLPLSLSLFIPSILVWVGTKGVRPFLAHLLPTGSPGLLWGFLAVVELISVLIRPLTLSIRLVANMMAGHIFIEMLTNLIVSFPPMIPLGIGLLLILLMFEVAVSVIQALVFSSLLSMFWSEHEEGH